MPSNVTLNSGSGGSNVATKQRSHDGDTTQVQVVNIAGVTGTEDSYTHTDVAAGGGVEAAALRVTIASDSTGVLSVDDNGGSLTVDGTVTANLAAGTNNIGDVDILSIAAGDNNIGNVDVVTLPALPAGTNNIGDVDVLSVVPGTGATNLGKAEDAAHSSGDVGVMALAVRQNSQADLGADGDYVPLTIDDSGGVRVSIVAGAGSGGTATADDADFTAGTTQGTIIQGVYESSPTSVTDGDVGAVGITQNRELKVSVSSGGVSGIAEDAASAGGEEGIAVLAVRRDAASSGVGADGDFAFLSVTSDGSLRVSGGGGGTQFAEDAAHTSADVGTVALAVRRDTPAVGSGTDGDYSTLNVNSAGRLYTSTTLDAAIPAGTNNIGDVDILSVVPGTGATALGKAEDAAHASGDTGVAMLAVRRDTAASGAGADGDYATLNVDSVGAQWVRSTGELADDTAFTPSTSRITPVGFVADETAPDSVDEGDVGAARMSLDRKQYVIAHQETSTIYQNGTARTPVFAAIDAATSGDNTLVAAAGAGNIIRVHQLLLVAAGTVNARFESGAGGTALTGQMNLVANNGFVLPYSPIGWFQTAANTLLNLELSAAVSVDGVLAYTVVT